MFYVIDVIGGINIAIVSIMMLGLIIFSIFFKKFKDYSMTRKFNLKNAFKPKCYHSWKVLVNKELDSAYEQLVKQGETFDTLVGTTWGVDLFRKTGVIIMMCEECGELDKTFIDTTGRRGYE